MWRICLAALFTVLSTNSSAQTHRKIINEGAVAVELFRLIADQSGCDTYVVAWLDRVRQQVLAECTETIEQSRQVLASSGASTRFVIDVSIAKIDGREPLNSIVPKRSASVLAYLLARPNRAGEFDNRNAPLLLYNLDGDREESNFIFRVRRTVHESGGSINFGRQSTPSEGANEIRTKQIQ